MELLLYYTGRTIHFKKYSTACAHISYLQPIKLLASSSMIPLAVHPREVTQV